MRLDRKLGFYERYIKRFLDVVCSLGGKVLSEKQWVYYAVMILAFIATFFLDVNVVYIILAAAAVGIVQALVAKRRRCGK